MPAYTEQDALNALRECMLSVALSAKPDAEGNLPEDVRRQLAEWAEQAKDPRSLLEGLQRTEPKFLPRKFRLGKSLPIPRSKAGFTGRRPDKHGHNRCYRNGV